MQIAEQALLAVARDCVQCRVLVEDAQIRSDQASWSALLGHKTLWALRDDSDHSVRFMDDQALIASVVEDVLLAHVCQQRGALGGYPIEQLGRFLPPGLQTTRCLAAAVAAVDLGMIAYDRGALVCLDRARCEDFCGVYHDLCEGPDVLDDLMGVGGIDLVAESFSDLLPLLAPS